LDRRLNVLDWQAHADHPVLRRLAAECAERGEDVFEVLAREHGIDVIVNNFVLVQNADAVRFPRDAVELIVTYGTKLDDPHNSLADRVEALDTYRRLFQFAKALGREDLRAPEDYAGIWVECIREGRHPVTALEMYCADYPKASAEVRSGLPEPLDLARSLLGPLKEEIGTARYWRGRFDALASYRRVFTAMPALVEEGFPPPADLCALYADYLVRGSGGLKALKSYAAQYDEASASVRATLPEPSGLRAHALLNEVRDERFSRSRVAQYKALFLEELRSRSPEEREKLPSLQQLASAENDALWTIRRRERKRRRRRR
jgi:hypothetical protein